ncbi:hypothetical protein QJQ45_012690 [Haematococcus lacustris]|nr:hypothetical protein QJQ45_012690 [Haematococcus lacustris]
MPTSVAGRAALTARRWRWGLLKLATIDDGEFYVAPAAKLSTRVASTRLWEAHIPFYRGRAKLTLILVDSSVPIDDLVVGPGRAGQCRLRLGPRLLAHLAAASSAGTSLEANLKHNTATLATGDAVWEVYLDPNGPPQAPTGPMQPHSQQPQSKGPSTPPPAKRTKAKQGKAAKAKPAPQPGRWLDRDCNAALNM